MSNIQNTTAPQLNRLIIINENKITFVIGSAPESFYFYRLKERPKGFIDRVKKDIIKYYKN